LTIDVGGKSQTTTDDQVTVHVAGGDQVVLSIPEKAVSGYRWQLDADQAPAIQVVKDDFQLPPGSDGNVDQIGTHILTLAVAASAPPTMAVALSLRRPWSHTDPPVAQKHLTFTT
jgi:predicted secreted protein